MEALEPPFVIREGTAEDAELLAELGARTFRQTYAESTDSRDLDLFVSSQFAPHLQEAELADPRNRHLLLALENIVVGFALVREEAPEADAGGVRPLLLSQLYVDRAFQGRKLGAALMARCLELAREGGHDVLWLGVWELNTRAIAFYERWGFERVGEAPFPFGRGTHRDLLYALRLTVCFGRARSGDPGPMRRFGDERGAVGWLLIGILIGIVLVFWAIFSLIF